MDFFSNSVLLKDYSTCTERLSIYVLVTKATVRAVRGNKGLALGVRLSISIMGYGYLGIELN